MMKQNRTIGAAPADMDDIQFASLPSLPVEFYLNNTVDVARALIGKVITYNAPEGFMAGRIVETEAYLSDDPACHASRGITKRNAAMFGNPGRAYVYLIYGIYYCLNAVTSPPGIGEAVLIRALEPLAGIDMMITNRGENRLTNLCSGPGKLCKAFGLNNSHNGLDLTTSVLRIVDDGYKAGDISAVSRIGISQAVENPWRFYLSNSDFVSKK